MALEAVFKKIRLLAALAALLLFGPVPVRTLAQPDGVGPPPGRNGPPLRYHEVVQADGMLLLVRADEAPGGDNEVAIEVVGERRVIRSNGIPQHNTGAFPNAGNPNAIRAQAHTYSVAAEPEMAASATPVRGVFGIYVNGVPFDPGAAEFFHGKRRSDWQYEALSGAVALGLDANHAHVQPNGAYHYHAKPTLLLAELGLTSAAHSPLIGWAADGVPIYAIYGYGADGASVRELKSGYRVKSGERPDGEGEPGGVYDGTFSRDYEYVDGAGDLDQCNGKLAATPEFPAGTYAYFLTNDWPYVPRCHMGTPSQDFVRGGPGLRPTKGWRGRRGR